LPFEPEQHVAWRFEVKPRPIVLNQSGLKTLCNCPRLYGWQQIQGLEPIGRRSAPEIGIAVHAGLAVLHAEKGTISSALEAAQAKLAERAGPSSSFEDKDLGEAASIVQKLLPAYAAHWGTREEMWAPIDAEIQFLVEVQPGWWHRTFSGEVSDEEGKRLDAAWLADPSGIWLCGRADNLSTMMNGIYLVDYKTSAKMDPRELLKYELDLQLTAYIYGISKQLTADSLAAGGEPIAVQGAIIDLLVKTQVPQFARESFTRSAAEMYEFEEEFVEYGRRLREQTIRVENGENWKFVFPKSTEQCFRYGTCAFRDLCLQDSPVRRLAYNKREPNYVQEAQVRLEKEWGDQ